MCESECVKEIEIWGIKQNNLKNIEVKIPLGELTVICGPSGSGKSSLAFETLFAEGQRRFIESMSVYARQFLNKAPKPDIEGITNIPPAISIEQKNSVRNSRSTVGTTTEIHDYLRLLFEKIGKFHCPTHKIPTTKFSVTEATDLVCRKFEGQRGYVLISINSKNRVLEGKKLLAQLTQDGFLRIANLQKSTGSALEVLELKNLKNVPKEDFYLVIDRLSFSQSDRDRLADSINQAYDTSLKYNLDQPFKTCEVITVGGDRLRFSEENSCPTCGFVAPDLTSGFFSFNSPLGACQTCKGFGNVLTLDEAKVIPNPELSISEDALSPFSMPSAAEDRKALIKYCKKAKIDISTPWKSLPEKQRQLIWNGSSEFFGIVGLFEMLEQMKYKMHVRVFISRFRSPKVCNECEGGRLRSETQHVLIKGYNINDLSKKNLKDLLEIFERMELSPYEADSGSEAFKQIKSRLSYLNRVGVHYLSLDRETKSLSGGEYQRIMLANQLGMGLSQTLYVLDEPTIGLHPRDNDRLISIIKDIRDLGNTVVIVEHDHDVIESSENIIEMGPGSGSLGGEVIYTGTTEKFYKSAKSNTVRYLGAKNRKRLIAERPVNSKTHLYKVSLQGCSGNNLKNIDIEIPLHRIVTITGVSGSGKSTLITHTLYPALARALNVEYTPAQKFRQIKGTENLKNVLLIDQSSIGKSARSSPVTYLKAFDAIRALFSEVSESKFRGYTAGTFSLNVDGGRCPSCKGTGFEEIDMQFMDNVIIPCDSCNSKKYRDEILEIKYNQKNISEVLAMTVKEAMEFFVSVPAIRRPLSILKDVGLDYLTLGQPSSTLSGGESQRLKIAKELNLSQQKGTLYILDEPTTGLHFKEIELLVKVLNQLVDNGNSVILVEHNLDIIMNSDYIIDLGPDAGIEGGEIVAQGSVKEIMESKKSLTGSYLKKYIEGL